MARGRRTTGNPSGTHTETYQHPEAEALLRLEVGAQPKFKKAKPPARYRYDSSLSPALDWDGQNPARETAEALIRELAECGLKLAELVSGSSPNAGASTPESGKTASSKKSKTPDSAGAASGLHRQVEELRRRIRDAESQLRRISGPFLNWTGKAERLSFEVPTLPLFVHEKLSTQGIIETLKGHKSDRQLDLLDSLYGGDSKPLADQVLHAYEHADNWRNRLILGDSLVVMNSLLRFENLGGQVQMIYLDPPYGVKFGSNFQPFVRKRDVGHNDDEDLTREPEMVQAYRDTWELGLHSYLTYLRDRLLLARDLLTPSGSIFVQISDENLHHVRELMDEVFGTENFVASIAAVKTSGLGVSQGLASEFDYVLWYAKDRALLKSRDVYVPREIDEQNAAIFSSVELDDGSRRRISIEERRGERQLPNGARRYRISDLTKPGPGSRFVFQHEGRDFDPGRRWWGTTPDGMQRLASANRLQSVGKNLYFVRFWNDFPFRPVTTLWSDTGTGGFVEEKLYVVQTNSKIIERCIHLTTDPGDLVLDPTCGSGTTAYVAENWGRRWITTDTSRVPLALARQRLLTATFEYFELKDEARGPAGGFVYKREQNKKGEEIGGIVPHVTLKSIANNEIPKEEVLVDRPEKQSGVTRVCGPFVVEATMPTAQGIDESPPTPAEQSEQQRTHVERMIDVLRRSPVLRLPENKTVTLKNVRPPARSLTLSAEALVENGEPKAVAILFGPESGPISERFVREAWDEAELKHYKHFYVIGFAIEPKAREFIERARDIGLPATYLAATMDLQMGDLLKNLRSSQIFSVCGLPDVAIKKLKKDEWQVELLGLDTFDPVSMEPQHFAASDVPAWLLDTDYNGMVFNVRQAFFPRTGAWDNLKKALKADYEEGLWDHLAGTVSAPFIEGDHGRIAVKVIDPRGNELLVVKKLEAKK